LWDWSSLSLWDTEIKAKSTDYLIKKLFQVAEILYILSWLLTYIGLVEAVAIFIFATIGFDSRFKQILVGIIESFSFCFH